MSWASVQDIKDATGTQLDDTILQALIDSAEREINARLAPLGISGDSDLREASLHLSISRLYTRMDLVGQLTQPTINGSIANHEARAWDLVDKYIGKRDRGTEVKRWVSIR